MWSAFNTNTEYDGLRRLFDQVFSENRQRPSLFNRFSFEPGFAARSYPLMNVHEDGENVYVEALAPGIDPKSLELSVTGNVLRVSGEKPASDAGLPPERIHRSERSAGKFIRTLTLPRDVDEKGVEAEYRNGVLAITLPKLAAAKPRQIAVAVK